MCVSTRRVALWEMYLLNPSEFCIWRSPHRPRAAQVFLRSGWRPQPATSMWSPPFPVSSCCIQGYSEKTVQWQISGCHSYLENKKEKPMDLGRLNYVTLLLENFLKKKIGKISHIHKVFFKFKLEWYLSVHIGLKFITSLSLTTNWNYGNYKQMAGRRLCSGTSLFECF